MNSELITSKHLNRKALIYIRQSSPHQVLTNQESLRLQYALQQKAQELGWRQSDIEVIDADLGLSGSTAEMRTGYKEVLAQVAMGRVGIILSYEVQRLSRNCSDWYPLLDICAYQHCLIADSDGIYDSGSANGRLLLGLKGQLSEMELHSIQLRLRAGVINKAERGELALRLPVGLVRDELGVVHKDPDQEVQARLQLVFSTFLRLRTAYKVQRYFKQHDLRVPRHDRFSDTVWKKPRYHAILEILKNPAYAGAFVYGRTRKTSVAGGKSHPRDLPIEQWRICIQDRYPAYIDWPTFLRIQTMLADNYGEYFQRQSRGVPRSGKSLLQGLVYCGKCGHKMRISYKDQIRYQCHYLWQERQAPVCQNVPAEPIEEAVVAAFFEAFSCVTLDAYAEAVAAEKAEDQAVDQAQTQQLKRLRYEVALAERRYNRTDPDMRLVAAELEKRWEAALLALKDAEEALFECQQVRKQLAPLPSDLREAFTDVGQKLPKLWQENVLTTQQKKALLRCLIEKVVVNRKIRDSVYTRIVWRGGDVTVLDIPVTVASFAQLSNAAELEQKILELSRNGQSDEDIANHLSALGYRSPSRLDKLLVSTVQHIRLKHRVFQGKGHACPRQVPGYLTAPQVAQALGVSYHWLHLRIQDCRIQITKDTKTGLYLFPDRPDTLKKLMQLKNQETTNLRF